MARLGRAAGAVVLVLLVLWCVAFTIPSKRAYSHARTALTDRLAAAKTMQERREATRQLGASIEREDGTWIAIAYSDSHSMPGDYSCSIARCSDGNWFECGEHFCGALSYYAKLSDDIRETSDPDSAAELIQQRRERCADSAAWAGLESIRTAGSLPAALDQLRAMGFRPMRRP
jgi:hypothetical protein